ncbi:MAG TPA: lipid-A-disaccharide synthase N-terminal domain-containing protein [Alphaproteobacteria bacterium]|nr:lipid-A-disaccharide synthase N-terminal domain-containing protein [Alphaproteobacteria bacterium]HNS44926.1 lipid-A-disaccharide synthase N-terminal domain-containing protein [Alphaproteobacteria bacterium]
MTTAETCIEAAKDPMVWLVIGFMGQAMFSARFLIQWLASEKIKKSIIPNLFWWFSLAGGSILLIYAIHREDPVFIVGQGMGLFIYFRNIYLIYSKKHNPPKTEQPAE